jgi:hypothetical protein
MKIVDIAKLLGAQHSFVETILAFEDALRFCKTPFDAFMLHRHALPENKRKAMTHWNKLVDTAISELTATADAKSLFENASRSRKPLVKAEWIKIATTEMLTLDNTIDAVENFAVICPTETLSKLREVWQKCVISKVRNPEDAAEYYADNPFLDTQPEFMEHWEKLVQEAYTSIKTSTMGKKLYNNSSPKMKPVVLKIWKEVFSTKFRELTDFYKISIEELSTSIPPSMEKRFNTRLKRLILKAIKEGNHSSLPELYHVFPRDVQIATIQALEKFKG